LTKNCPKAEIGTAVELEIMMEMGRSLIHRRARQAVLITPANSHEVIDAVVQPSCIIFVTGSFENCRFDQARKSLPRARELFRNIEVFFRIGDRMPCKKSESGSTPGVSDCRISSICRMG